MVAKLAESVFDCRGVVVIDYDGISQRQNSVNLELLLLPLAGDTGHRRALGIISAQRSPYWLGTDPLSDAKMNSVRVVDPDREPLFLKNRPAVPVPSLAPSESGGLAELDPADGRTAHQASRCSSGGSKRRLIQPWRRPDLRVVNL